MTEEEQPKRILSWMALSLLERQQKWRLKVAKQKGEDTTELEKRVNAIRQAKNNT